MFYEEENRKAQAAIEYLMTYGWMLIAVGIAGTTVFQVVSGECVAAVSGFEGEEGQIEDFGLSEDGEMILSVRNSGREQLELEEIRLSMGEEITYEEPTIIDQGSRNAVAVGEGFVGSEDCEDIEVELLYSFGPLEDLTSSGVITAPIRSDQRAPNPPENMDVS